MLLSSKFDLTMGGLTGHMIHPYECKDMTIGSVKDMVKGIFNGEVAMTEKVDGLNIQVTVNRKGEVVFIRNKADLNSPNGGMTIDDMITKWYDCPEVCNTYVEAAKILTDVLKGRRFSFNPRCDLKLTLNCECVRKGVTNVMYYDRPMVVLHNIWVYTRGEYGWEKVCETTKGLDKLVGEGVEGPVNLLICKCPYGDLLERIDEVLGNDNDMTLDHWMWTRYINLLNANPMYSWILSDSRGCCGLYLRWFYDDKSVNLRSLKEMYRDHIPALSCLESSKGRPIVTEVKKDLDDLFIEIGQRVMGNVSGYINCGNDAEVVDYLMEDLEEAVDNIMESGNEENTYKVDQQLRRMRGGLLPLEGVVFNWNGQLMKLTGNFAPLNQIMGFVKFDR